MEKTRKIALIAVFGALHASLSLIPGLWRSLMILILPLEGIILGPAMGFSSASIGYVVGWTVRPREDLFIFGFGEPVGALCAGLAAKRKWSYVFFVYTVMLSMFFLHPITPNLPLWALWDVYLAYASIILLAIFARKRASAVKTAGKTVFGRVAAAAFLGVEADVLTRIVILLALFTPVGFYPVSTEAIQYLSGEFVKGAFLTPVEAAIAVASTVFLAIPLLRILEKNGLFESEKFELKIP